MYEYHGWLSTYSQANAIEIEKRLVEINDPYPVFAKYVNGQLHISFSGNPNREGDYIKSITEYLLGLKLDFYGIIYLKDTNKDRIDRFNVVKVLNDKTYIFEDKNFSIDETKQLFK